ncbi:hypothetical protein D3C81_1015040 [compost metagenome]
MPVELLQDLREPFVECLAITEAGEGVLVGQAEQLVLVGQLTADIAQDAPDAGEFAVLAGDDRHQGFQVHLGPVRAGERCGEAQVGFAGKRAFLQLPAALQVLSAEQQADGLADQFLGAIADHLAERRVDHQEVAGGVHLDIAVADRVEDGLVACFAPLQAFDHAVEFAAELA